VLVLETSLPAEVRDSRLAQERLLAALIAVFAGLAVLLSCLGLVGTLAHIVARRTAEIGVRVALGARRVNVIGMVVRETLLPVVAGLAAGSGAAVAAARMVRGFLFGVSFFDPGSLAGAALLFALAAMAGAAIPARTAARIEPAIALRHE
jgi:ABC-type antimicrobial peptide transport system permease subunit